MDRSPISRMKHKKDFDELLGAAYSIINEADPHRMSKTLHLKNWCRAFLEFFIKVDEEQNTFRRERLPFFIDVLSDETIWEETDTIHRVKLNRRTTAKKIVQSHSPSGIPNPLDFNELYRIACSCSLEEDILILFENFKQNSGISSEDVAELNKLVGKELCKGRRAEPLTIYWSHLVGGFASEMNTQGKHLYEFGLYLVYVPYVPYVEAVEYFWNKISSLPENELSDGQKYEIFINYSVRSSANRIGELPEIFEYCIRQMDPTTYSDFLDKEFNEHKRFASLDVLEENLCFDVLQKLFYYVYPKYYITDSEFYSTLQNLAIPDYPENYASEAAALFMCMWTREACNRHCSFVLGEELDGNGTMLVSLIKKSYMELVWAVLDKDDPDHIKAFMRGAKASYITSLLTQKGDPYSLNKFLSYNYAIRRPDPTPSEPSSSHMEVDVDVTTPSPTKKHKRE